MIKSLVTAAALTIGLAGYAVAQDAAPMGHETHHHHHHHEHHYHHFAGHSGNQPRLRFVELDGHSGHLRRNQLADRLIFKRNGVAIGRSKLAGGSARLILGRGAARNGRIVAVFQGNSQFRRSTSPPVALRA